MNPLLTEIACILERSSSMQPMAAIQDAMAPAAAMCPQHDAATNLSFTGVGIRPSDKAMSRKVRAMRMKGSGTMEPQAMADDAKSMERIVREEESKPD